MRGGFHFARNPSEDTSGNHQNPKQAEANEGNQIDGSARREDFLAPGLGNLPAGKRRTIKTMDKTKHSSDCICAWCEVERQGTMNRPTCWVSFCDGCHKRRGKLTHQFAHGPRGRHVGIERFVFRSYHCPWCLGAENRRLKREGKSLWRYVQHKPDAEILSNHEQ